VIPHVERRGDGPLLLCHPGGPGFPGSELDDLGGLDRSRTLLLIDPRGSGATPPGESYRLDDYVGDLEELRVELALEQIDLLGFSHGGMVAAAYAIEHPGRVRKLVLAGGLAAVTDELNAEAERFMATKADEPWFARAAGAVRAESSGDYGDPAQLWNDMTPLYFSTWDERYRPLVELKELRVEPMAEFSAAPPDLRDELGRITAPTLVITGRDDFVCGPAAAQPLADGIPGAELVLLDDAGHMTFLERPDAFRAAVEGFLAR
jgi:proline iminopeptidase